MTRELRCKNFEDIRAELARLEQGPVETTRKWSYFQMISHLAGAVEGSLKGLRREMPIWKRYFLGPYLAKLFAFRGYIPEGIKGRPSERIEGNEKDAVLQLRKALEDFEKSTGPYSDHPVLGRLNKKQWMIFHVLHFNNHVRHADLKKQNP
jgi:hypothetical protein